MPEVLETLSPVPKQIRVNMQEFYLPDICTGRPWLGRYYGGVLSVGGWRLSACTDAGQCDGACRRGGVECGCYQISREIYGCGCHCLGRRNTGGLRARRRVSLISRHRKDARLSRRCTKNQHLEEIHGPCAKDCPMMRACRDSTSKKGIRSIYYVHVPLLVVECLSLSLSLWLSILEFVLWYTSRRVG